MPAVTTVLFDLDGTLLDTAPDMAQALNTLRRARNLPELPLEIIKPAVGYGSKALLKLAFNIDDSHDRYNAFLEEFFNAYKNCLAHKTTLFAGMPEVLNYLEGNNITWGIVTNKPKRFTHDLLDELDLSKRSAVTICGDTLPQRKPHPAPILHACEILKCPTSGTLYVGDAATDIIASKAAGVSSLAALYGYISAEEDPYTWQADGYINAPSEIINWLTK
jgi:2-phosphoglycolate phosphatase